MKAFWLPVTLALFACQPSVSSDLKTVEVRSDDLVQEVEVTGELEAIDAVAIAPPQLRHVWEYKIAFLADDGTTIEAGEPVVGFDTSDLEQRLKKEEAELDRHQQELERRMSDFAMSKENDELRLIEAQAKEKKMKMLAERPEELVASLDLAEADLNHELAKKEVAFARSQFESRRQREQADIHLLRTRIERSRDDVEDIKSSLGSMTVKSPRDGVVIHHTDRHGNKKKVGDNTWRGAVISEVVSLDSTYGLGRVNEIDTRRIKVGQPVRLRLEAYPDDEFSGKIRRIEETVTTEGRKKVMKLEIEFSENDPVKMRPGMRFRGNVEVQRIENALQVPIRAVIASEKQRRVQVLRDGRLQLVPVELGARGADTVQVLDGLGPDDQVVLPAAGAET